MFPFGSRTRFSPYSRIPPTIRTAVNIDRTTLENLIDVNDSARNNAARALEQVNALQEAIVSVHQASVNVNNMLHAGYHCTQTDSQCHLAADVCESFNQVRVDTPEKTPVRNDHLFTPDAPSRIGYNSNNIFLGASPPSPIPRSTPYSGDSTPPSVLNLFPDSSSDVSPETPNDNNSIVSSLSDVVHQLEREQLARKIEQTLKAKQAGLTSPPRLRSIRLVTHDEIVCVEDLLAALSDPEVIIPQDDLRLIFDRLFETRLEDICNFCKHLHTNANLHQQACTREISDYFLGSSISPVVPPLSDRHQLVRDRFDQLPNPFITVARTTFDCATSIANPPAIAPPSVFYQHVTSKEVEMCANALAM